MLIIITGKIKAGYKLGVRPDSEKNTPRASSHKDDKDVDAAMFSQNFKVTWCNLGVSQLIFSGLRLWPAPSFLSLPSLPDLRESSGPLMGMK